MAGRTRDLTVRIVGDASSANRAFKQIDDTAGKTESRMGKVSKAFTAAGVAAGGALVVGLKKSADAAIEAEKSQSRLETQLKASGTSYAAHAKQIDEVIAKTSKLAAVDDEDLQDALSNLVRSTGDVDKSLKLLGLTTDLARAKNLDLEKAAQLVGRVANGNVTALSRYGVTIDKNATSQEALAAAQQKFAGQAAAYGRTSAGSLDRIGIATENLQERIGSALLPVVARLANGLARLIGWFERNRTATTGLIAALGAAAVAWAGYTAAAAAAAVATTVATGGLTLIIPVLAAFSAAVAVAYKRSATFRNVVDQVWDVLKNVVPQIVAVRVAIAHAGDAFDVAKKAARGVGSAVEVGIIRPFNKIVAAGRKVVDVLRGVTGVAGKLGSVAGSVGGFLGGIGDGLGRVPDLTAPIGPAGPLGTGAGGLMGADRALAPFAAIGARAGLQVTSGKRAAGGRTSSGGISFHGSGEAIDISGSPAGMMATFRTLKSRFGSRLAELIYTPGGVGVKNGQPFTYTGSVAADHFDHVHVALDLGRPGPGIGDGPGKSLSGVNLAIDAARKAGFTGNDLVNMVAIAGRESSYNPGAQNLKYPDHSIGLWQINQLAHKGRYGSDAQLKNAYTNAKAARALFKAAGLSPWQHAGGPLGGTDVAAARKAVAAFSGGGGSSSSGSARGAKADTDAAAGAAAEPTPSAYEERRSTADLDVATAGATPGARDDVTALLKQDKVIAKRMASVRKKLKKGGLSRATRIRLQGELAQLTGERAGVQSALKDARTSLLPAQVDSVDGGDAGDDAAAAQQQALIDALQASAEATKAHTDALNGVGDQLKRQTDFAVAASNTQQGALMRALMDVVTGQLGARTIDRGRTAGTGAIAVNY